MTRSEKIRRDFKRNDDIRDAGLCTPDSIERFDDICYGSDTTWQMLDVYKPKDYTGKLPLIVSVHGGGWVYGDKERYQFYCMELAKQGFAVVNYTYRLAPEFKFPAPIEDTALVFDWILEHVNNYNFDVKNVFAVGDSAGAHILSMYMALITNKEYENILADRYNLKLSHRIITARQKFIKDTVKTRNELIVKAIGLNCGIYRLDERKELIYDYLEGHGSESELELLDVTRYITKDFPDSFIMTCYGDFLLKQPLCLIPELIDMKVPFVYKVYGDSDNMLSHVFHCDLRSETGKLCNIDECDYFKAHI